MSVQVPLNHKQNLSLLPIQAVDCWSGKMWNSYIVGFHLFQSNKTIERQKAEEIELALLPKEA